MELFTPLFIAELYCLDYTLAEVTIFGFKAIHDESVVGEEMHSASMVDYVGFGYLYQFEEFFSAEFHSVTASVYGGCCCSSGCCDICHTIFSPPTPCCLVFGVPLS